MSRKILDSLDPEFEGPDDDSNELTDEEIEDAKLAEALDRAEEKAEREERSIGRFAE